MTTAELINNARECACDALVLLDTVEKLSDPHLKAKLLGNAFGLLRVGSEEASRANKQVQSESAARE